MTALSARVHLLLERHPQLRKLYLNEAAVHNAVDGGILAELTDEQVLAFALQHVADVLSATRAAAERRQATFCRGCACEIDPDCCWCGEPRTGGDHSGHGFVPMGCDCLREAKP